MCRSRSDEPGLAFFAPDITEISTIKRVEAFIDNDMRPLVLSFRRERCNRGYAPRWPHVALGLTHDGRHWHRMIALAAAVPALVRQRSRLGTAPVFYARNLDLLILALLARRLFNRDAVVVYEVLDIQPAFLKPRLGAALLRAIERWCLKRVALLVLSSPGFLRNYYVARQNYRGGWFLQENKLHRSALDFLPRDAAARVGDPSAPHWSIGYCGLIRGEATMRLVQRLADRLGAKVRFRFHGVFTTVSEATFRALFEGRRNVVYAGEYAHPRDLATVYDGVDFAWAIDLEDAEHNSRWLLPNRFYEAGICGVPCLAVAGFELGLLLDRLGVGWSFEAPLEDTLVRFFETVDAADYEARRRRLAAMPSSSFVAGEEFATLCATLKRAGEAGQRRTITSQ